MLDVVNEPKLVQMLNEEYYRLINFYSNTKRSANFIRYYNLAMDISPHNEITEATYDFYTKTANKWDLYELTPMQIISAIQNSPENLMDLKGNMIVSATTILTYTIENPRIGDLVTFYKPAQSEEVLRVMNVRLQLNSNFSSEPVRWYELDLETAPIKNNNLKQLLKRDHYIYDLTIEKNVKYKYYKEFVKKINILEKLLKDVNELYIGEADLYMYDLLIPRELNELIYYVKKNFDNKYHRLLEQIKSPFGYWDKYNLIYSSLDEMNFDETMDFHLINYKTKEETEYHLSSLSNDEGLDGILSKTIEILNYIREVKKYVGHTITLDTEQY